MLCHFKTKTDILWAWPALRQKAVDWKSLLPVSRSAAMWVIGGQKNHGVQEQ